MTAGRGTTYLRTYELLQHADCYIELLEDCPCDTKAQLLKRKGELIREHRECAVNIHIAGAKVNNPNYDAEYKKLWHMRNRDRILAKKKKYREDHKEEILQKAVEYRRKNRNQIDAWKKTKVRCGCGAEVSKTNFARHKKSKKHLSWENSQPMPSMHHVSANQCKNTRTS